MWLRNADPDQQIESRRVPSLQLGGQVFQFVGELALGHLDGCERRRRGLDLSPVETVSPGAGLIYDPVQVRGDGSCGGWVVPEAVELRMAAIAAGVAAEHFLRQKPFSP